MSAVPIRDEAELSGELDLAALRAAIRRRRKLLIGATAGAFFLIGLFVNVVSPRYTGEAQVILENQESFFTGPERTVTGNLQTNPIDSEAVGSQIQLITSRDLARQAISRLHLAGNPEFDPVAGGAGPLRSVLALVGLVPDPTRTAPEDRILETFQDRLTVFSPPKTRVINIDFQSRDPELAARAANVVAQLYLETQANAKRESARAAANSLGQEITSLRPKLAKANADVEDFRLKNGLLAGANNMTIAGQQLAELNSQLAQSRTLQADGQAKAALIRDMIRQGRVSDVPDVANNELVRRIAEQRVTLRAQLALESRTLLPQHPRIKELTAQLDDLDAQLRIVADRTARTLENDARIAGARVANLEAALEQQKRTTGSSNIEDVRLRELQRVADSYKDQLDSSMAKYQEAIARENAQSTPADARIISNAMAPQIPSFPKKVPMVVFGTLATFVAVLGFIVSAELLSGSGGLTPAAPGAPTSRPRIDPTPMPLRARLREFGQSAVAARTQAGGVVSEASPVVDLAHQIRRSHELGLGGRVVATSPSGSAESAASLAALARGLASDGRAIVVDVQGDVARLMHDSVGKPQFGLADLLAGHASFAEVIHRDAQSRLHFVPAGVGPIADLRDFDLVLDALSETYDYLILIAPALDASDLACDYAPRMEFTVLALDGPADAPQSVAAHEKLLAAGAREVALLGLPGPSPSQQVA